MRKILSMILVISTVLMAETDCEKDIKKLYPIARKWVNFTTEFNAHFKTDISVLQKGSPIIIDYVIKDLQKKPIFKDRIIIPVKVQVSRNWKPAVITGVIALFSGVIGGIIIGVKIEN